MTRTELLEAVAEAARAFDNDLSEYCDGEERDALRAALVALDAAPRGTTGCAGRGCGGMATMTRIAALALAALFCVGTGPAMAWEVLQNRDCAHSLSERLLTAVRDTVGIATEKQLVTAIIAVARTCDVDAQTAAGAVADSFERVCPRGSPMPCKAEGL